MDFDLSSFLKCGSLFSKTQSTLLVGYGKRTWLTASTSLAFYYPDFFLTNEKPWFVHEHMQEISLGELSQALKAVSFTKNKEKRTWKQPDRSCFDDTISDLHQRFANGELIKAVPYVCQHSDDGLSDSQLVQTLSNILNYGSTFPVYLYGFWDEHNGLLGATPEILFRLHENILETMACAGTRRCGPDQHLIAQDPKELYEHQLVVDDITKSLAPYGKIILGKQEVRPFNKLVHLVTPLHVNITKTISFSDVVKAMHPTPALGAVPRNQGSAWLAQYACTILPRGRYGAPAGYVNGDNGVCAVAIRNMQWQDNRVSLYAGCGVVPDSNAENEWHEIQLKLQSIKELLSL